MSNCVVTVSLLRFTFKLGLTVFDFLRRHFWCRHFLPPVLSWFEYYGCRSLWPFWRRKWENSMVLWWCLRDGLCHGRFFCPWPGRVLRVFPHQGYSSLESRHQMDSHSKDTHWQNVHTLDTNSTVDWDTCSSDDQTKSKTHNSLADIAAVVVVVSDHRCNDCS